MGKKGELSRSLSPFVELEGYNLIIEVSNEQEMIGLYGHRKKFTTIALHIDNPEDFRERVQQLT